jgi:hypothetical protein
MHRSPYIDKVKRGKVDPMLNVTPHYEDVWGIGDKAPCILNVGNSVP